MFSFPSTLNTWKVAPLRPLGPSWMWGRRGDSQSLASEQAGPSRVADLPVRETNVFSKQPAEVLGQAALTCRFCYRS